MDPATVPPLDGHALVCVAVMGFLPPVFALMLLQTHGLRSWYLTLLVTGCYILNTVTFFLLYANLSNVASNPDKLIEGLQGLFSATACGGSSAMALCRQLVGTDPLDYLDGFFNKGPIPNIETVPVLWGWTTLVLLGVVLSQLFGMLAPEGSWGPPKPFEKRKADARGLLYRVVQVFRLPAVRFIVLIISSVLFCLALGYEFLAVRQYQLMDIIDETNWSFGQIVAVLFWGPPVLDTIQSLFKNRGSKEHGDMNGGVSAYPEPQSTVTAPEKQNQSIKEALFIPVWNTLTRPAYTPMPGPNPEDRFSAQTTPGYDNSQEAGMESEEDVGLTDDRRQGVHDGVPWRSEEWEDLVVEPPRAERR